MTTPIPERERGACGGASSPRSAMQDSEWIEARAQMTRRFGIAWLALAISLALHVTDEALTGFLSVWNPTVLAIRERIPWSPLPTFTFGVWISGLIAGVILLLLLSPLAFRGVRWFAFAALVFSVMMVGNGLLHLGASAARHHVMPGFWSSPLLVAAAGATLLCALGTIREGRFGPNNQSRQPTAAPPRLPRP